MNNFVQRIITILIGASLGIFLITYNQFTINLFFLTGLVFIYGELLYCLGHGDKLNLKELFILFIWIVAFYTGRYYIFLSLIILDNPEKLLIYLGIGLIWTYPTIYISYKYVQSDPRLFIVLSTIVWFSDGGAYITGKLFGKNKLAPNISPNKTIEGAIGGFLFPILISYLLSFYYSKISSFDFLMLGIIYGIFGQVGDLVESKFKRWTGVKDSGFLLGSSSGGICDKVDSLLFAIPIGHLYLVCRNVLN